MARRKQRPHRFKVSFTYSSYELVVELEIKTGHSKSEIVEDIFIIGVLAILEGFVPKKLRHLIKL